MGPRIVLTTVNALVQRVPPRSTVFAGASMSAVASTAQVKPDEAGGSSWRRNGYGRAGTVMEPGEYAMRGGIIDIFPAGEADPVRLDLFGDTIESPPPCLTPARNAVPAKRSQLLVLRPVSEVPLGTPTQIVPVPRPDGASCLDQEAASDPLYLSISDGRRLSGDGALGAAVSSDGMENLAGLSAGCRRQPGSPIRRGAGSPVGDDRRPCPGAEGGSSGWGGSHTGRSPLRAACISTAPIAGIRDAGPFGPVMLAFTPYRRSRRAPAGIDGGGRPGLRCLLNPEGASTGVNGVRPVARAGGSAWTAAGAADRGCRVDPRLTRAA